MNYCNIPLARIWPIAKKSCYLKDVLEKLPPADPLINSDGEWNPILGVLVELDEDSELDFDSPLIITSYNDDETIDLHHAFHGS